MPFEPNTAALQNPEVVRLLAYMAAFADPKWRVPVAALMDKLTHSPVIGSVVVARRHYPDDPNYEVSVPFPTAQLAAEAVDWIEGRRATKPEWLTQTGVV